MPTPITEHNFKNQEISQTKAIQGVLGQYPCREFESPFRSTIPLLSLIREENRKHLEAILCQVLPEPADRLTLEYEVPVQGEKARGRASCTDLLAEAKDHRVVIEAKWTEPRYPTVGEWLKSGKAAPGEGDRSEQEEATAEPTNRERVLQGWLGLLQPFAADGRELHAADFHGAVYQMVHRAASACYERKDFVGRHNPAMSYLVFEAACGQASPDHSHYRQDMEHLHALLGKPSNFPFFLITQPITPTAAFDKIRGLTKGLANTALQVKEALVGAPLFEFGLPTILGG